MRVNYRTLTMAGEVKEGGYIICVLCIDISVYVLLFHVPYPYSSMLHMYATWNNYFLVQRQYGWYAVHPLVAQVI